MTPCKANHESNLFKAAATAQNYDEGIAMSRTSLFIATLMLVPVAATAKNKDNGRPHCATTYSIVQEDALRKRRAGA